MNEPEIIDKEQKKSWNLKRYLIFFMLVSFTVTASSILLLSTMKFDINDIKHNWFYILGNTFFITFLFWAADGARRKITIDKPVSQITSSLNEITKGNFSVRIPELKSVTGYNEFNPIIRQINLMTEELSSVETLKTDFISNVSHEIKTPLSVIQNYSTMLQSPNLTEEERMQYARSITAASRRLSELITNILKLNKLENQQIYPEIKKYNLSEQLCECLLAFEEIWEKKEIEIAAEIDDEIFISADKELLSLVWNNLFSNAVKFTEPGGTVSLHLRREQDCATVEIADTGCGMSAETIHHIFDKFYQGDTSHSTQGNGLGLALVRRVIDITGGSITVSSTPGVGSIFTVRLRMEMTK